ncbi:hypothetical protein [Sinanaerobacter chloroacetimidivorans]|jgi:hypothetical protein|uniref:Uncharacterized protein n=1 Tax=Sinanaerobacter chloroacetimidivorans TaxID=2818044 RepID=A0A8J7W3U5_9FIRM|nr:hypothetical protein [Sinanaerobacter chloroacetimidivorans]MBR0598740.1 hypothetical protein [Sinanaerobacter chloroacetimidivorans]
MKKRLALLLSLTMIMVALAACGGKTEEPVSNDEPSAAVVKTGLAVITSTAKSTDAADADGLAQADSVVVAVTVDEAGKIVDAAIDQAQTKINFSKEGKIVTPLDTVFLAKQELGADYGMGKASSIGKEWNEQASAFADYVIGKTVDEIKGIAVNEEGVPTDAELASSVTVHITEFVEAIEKAVANAQDLGASADDKLGLGVITTIAKSKDAGDEDGLAQVYSNYTAVTFNADGVITSSIIDASQTNVTFSKEGKITSDIAGTYKTKNELGAEYGMAKASSIGKEWNEQAAAFAEYVVGKTVDEIKGIAVNEEGVATDAEITSSVTVHITDFVTIIEKAFNSAK